MSHSRFRGMACAAALLLGLAQNALACTRAMYVGADGTVITGRSMDWMEDQRTDLWVFPRGMARDGAAGRAVRLPAGQAGVIRCGGTPH